MNGEQPPTITIINTNTQVIRGHRRGHHGGAAEGTAVLIVLIWWPVSEILHSWAAGAIVTAVLLLAGIGYLVYRKQHPRRRHAAPKEAARTTPAAPVDYRVSDADRDRALTRLSEAFQIGQLTSDDFDQRSTGALAAHTRSQLAALLKDLPPIPAPAAGAVRRLLQPAMLGLGLALIVVVLAIGLRGVHMGFTGIALEVAGAVLVFASIPLRHLAVSADCERDGG